MICLAVSKGKNKDWKGLRSELSILHHELLRLLTVATLLWLDKLGIFCFCFVSFLDLFIVMGRCTVNTNVTWDWHSCFRQLRRSLLFPDIPSLLFAQLFFTTYLSKQPTVQYLVLVLQDSRDSINIAKNHHPIHNKSDLWDLVGTQVNFHNIKKHQLCTICTDDSRILHTRRTMSHHAVRATYELINSLLSSFSCFFKRAWMDARRLTY